jgi:hypothetical protein
MECAASDANTTLPAAHAIRRVKPLLSELQVPEWQELANEGPAEVEKDVEEHQDTEIACFAGTRSSVVCAKIPR